MSCPCEFFDAKGRARSYFWCVVGVFSPQRWAYHWRRVYAHLQRTGIPNMSPSLGTWPADALLALLLGDSLLTMFTFIPWFFQPAFPIVEPMQFTHKALAFIVNQAQVSLQHYPPPPPPFPPLKHTRIYLYSLTRSRSQTYIHTYIHVHHL